MQRPIYLRYTCIVVLSWPISYCLVAFATSNSWIKTNKITPMGRAKVQLQNIKSLTINEINPNGIQNEIELQLLKSKIKDDIGLDPWGNTYQVVDRIPNSSDQPENSFPYYSYGIDGKSRTQGNDPDDINLWDNHHHDHYERQSKLRQKRQSFIGALVLTPLIFVFLAFVQRWRAKRQVKTH
ncbi:MAG: hypothetical protein VX438_04310 [Planctomycetota bacterium]|nr:hypothetical protein [Planctomycetota bacterium]